MTTALIEGVQVQDMRMVRPYRHPHRKYTASPHEFIGKDRIVRVDLPRLEPGQTKTHDEGEFMARHRHNHDKLGLNITLPSPGSGADPAEPLSGTVTYHPEGGWYGPRRRPARPPEPVSEITVNCYLVTSGPLGDRFVTYGELEGAIADLREKHPEAVRYERSTFVMPDGEETDLYMAGVEHAMAMVGDTVHYPEPSTSDILMFNLNGFPWVPASRNPGVQIKPIASFNANGPHVRCIKLAPGGRLDECVLDVDRVIAVMAGRVRFGGVPLSDLHVLFGEPGMTFAPIEAEEPTFLAVFEWEPPEQALASIWRRW